MKRKFFVFILLFTLLSISNVFAIPELQLPYEGGLTLNVTRGYDIATHMDYGSYDTDDRKALDFVANGCDSWDSPILAVASGTIIKSHAIDDNGYGKYIIIDHGDGYHSRYAHLNSVNVYVGQFVVQGYEIGKMGNTGNVSGTACPAHPGTHLHFVLYYNGDACVPEPMSGYTNFEAREIYTSLNTYNPHNNYRVGKFTDGWKIENSNQGHFVPYSRPFAVAYYHNGGIELIGYPTESVYAGGKPLNSEDIYQQELITESGHIYKLILNPYVWNIRFEYLGVVFPVHGQILNYWEQHYFDLGAPVTNEYYYAGGYSSDPPRYVVQWFERSDNEYYVVIYDTWNGNIWHESEHITGVPKDEHFNQDKNKNCGCPNGVCGVGGDGTEPDDPDPTTYPIPQNLTAIPISHSQIRVSWDSNPDVLQHKIYFQGNGQEYDISVENNPRLFNSLEPNTAYSFRIQANYGDGNWSEISDSVQATTLLFNEQNITINTLTTCKGLINYKEAINPTDYFDNQNDDIYFLIKLEENYPYGSFYFRFDLYNPSDELNKSFDRMGNFDFDGPNFTTCAQLNDEENNLYNHNGTWNIKLYYGPTIYDINNYLTTYSFQIADIDSLPNQAPEIVSFIATPQILNNPFGEITFQAEAIDPDGDTLNYTIDFGDGSPNKNQNNAVHTYTAKGTYTAEVMVNDGNGNTATKSLQITVNDLRPSAPTGLTVR